MKIIRYVVAPVLTAGTLAANFVTTPAVAVTRPIPIPARFATATTPGTHVTVVMREGVPWWVFGVVAAVAAVLAVTTSIAVARLRLPAQEIAHRICVTERTPTPTRVEGAAEGS